MKVNLRIENYGCHICSVTVDHPCPSIGTHVEVDFEEEASISLRKGRYWGETDESLFCDPTMTLDGAYIFEIHKGFERDCEYFAETELQMDVPMEEDLAEGEDCAIF
ncbi:MAG TPA: hypothetical protein VJA87_00130 [Candidatus Paceibacterota bacterium]